MKYLYRLALLVLPLFFSTLVTANQINFSGSVARVGVPVTIESSFDSYDPDSSYQLNIYLKKLGFFSNLFKPKGTYLESLQTHTAPIDGKAIFSWTPSFPGHFRFEVIKRNSDGDIVEIVESNTLEILEYSLIATNALKLFRTQVGDFESSDQDIINKIIDDYRERNIKTWLLYKFDASLSKGYFGGSYAKGILIDLTDVFLETGEGKKGFTSIWFTQDFGAFAQLGFPVSLGLKQALIQTHFQDGYEDDLSTSFITTGGRLSAGLFSCGLGDYDYNLTSSIESSCNVSSITVPELSVSLNLSVQDFYEVNTYELESTLFRAFFSKDLDEQRQSFTLKKYSQCIAEKYSFIASTLPESDTTAISQVSLAGLATLDVALQASGLNFNGTCISQKTVEFTKYTNDVVVGSLTTNIEVKRLQENGFSKVTSLSDAVDKNRVFENSIIPENLTIDSPGIQNSK